MGIHVNDEFENDASLARVDYQKQTDPTECGTPTFLLMVKTAEAMMLGAMQSRILTQENNRMAPEDMASS